MGICKTFGSKRCIVNVRTGIRGRCFDTPKECNRNLAQAQCEARRRRTGKKVACPLPKP